ncbi:hypothetical protein BDZ97DRAFT_1001675 [Flammula alnicola]|nr:hypothetical protein BDZ97DRAFT_1001675 [Flammula alnicola]
MFRNCFAQVSLVSLIWREFSFSVLLRCAGCLTLHLCLVCGVINNLSSASSAAVVIYYCTKLENTQKFELEYELSTRSTSRHALCSPKSVSIFTGLLNTGGAYLRFRRIHFLQIPTIPWLAATIHGVKGGDELMKLLEAEWLVALNDWTSLFMALTFFLAGCFNFATVRQLRLRDQWVQEMLLPVYRPSGYGVTGDEKVEEVIPARDWPWEERNREWMLKRKGTSLRFGVGESASMSGSDSGS